MRILDKLISFLFDVLVIILAVTVVLVMTNVIGYPVVEGLLRDYVFNFDYQIIIISIAIIVILLGLKITVFSSALSKEAKKKIYVDTPHGKIQINQDTIEGIARNIIKDYPQVKDVQARMTEAKKGINMYMAIQVYQNTNIKDIVTKVQNDVKSQIENTTSVRVNNVDVKIRNVVQAAAPSKNNHNEQNTMEQVKVVPPVPEVPVVDDSASSNVTVPEFVSKPESDEYLRDENNVLYQVKANPEAESNTNSEQN